MARKLLFFFPVFFLLLTDVSGYYKFDSNLSSAYSSIMRLRFEEANVFLQKEAAENPENELRILYQNYIGFLRCFISEEKSDFENFKRLASENLTKLKEDEAGSSPFHLYAQSEILLQLALVRIKFGDYVIAAGEIRKSFKLIERNSTLFPTFQLNNKISGLLQIIIGSIPDKYQWMVKVAGMEGNFSERKKMLQELYGDLAQTQFSVYRTELLFFIGYMHASLASSGDSMQLIMEMKSSANTSPLLSYAYSNILIKEGKNEEALQVLNDCLTNYDAYPFNFLFYKRGLVRLRKLDLTAGTDFIYYLQNYKGVNNVKAAYQKLAWIDIIRGDTAGYFRNLKLCEQTGSDLFDEDKSALDEARSGVVINTYLLRARLLCDGGFYDKALLELTRRQIQDFPRYHDQLEITYRLGRIMQMTGKEDKAIEYYEKTLKNGLSSPYYFAANSALMLGMIYEENHQYEKAISYFEKCLAIEHADYKKSIDQKARAGIDRVKKKARN